MPWKYFWCIFASTHKLISSLVCRLARFESYDLCYFRYESAIKYLTTVPKYRLQAVEIAKKEGMIKDGAKRKKGKSKEEIKEEEEAILRKVIEQKMDIRWIIYMFFSSKIAQSVIFLEYQGPLISEIHENDVYSV